MEQDFKEDYNFEYDFSFEDSLDLDALYRNAEEEEVGEYEDEMGDEDASQCSDQGGSVGQNSKVTAIHYANNNGPTELHC